VCTCHCFVAVQVSQQALHLLLQDSASLDPSHERTAGSLP
jgi:hypothetical protein